MYKHICVYICILYVFDIHAYLYVYTYMCLRMYCIRNTYSRAVRPPSPVYIHIQRERERGVCTHTHTHTHTHKHTQNSTHKPKHDTLSDTCKDEDCALILAILLSSPATLCRVACRLCLGHFRKAIRRWRSC